MSINYFQEKVVLITGSARGIGFATGKLLGSRGAKIVLSDVLEDRLFAAEKELRAEGVEVFSKVADVTEYSDCESLVAAAVEKFGKIDALINNAGISIVSNIEDCRPETCKKLIDVNILGSVYMTIAGLDEIKKTHGHIVFLSSVSGVRAIPTGSLYSASKAFLRSFAESIRLELKPYAVHVGAIIPGFTTTDPTKTVMKGDGSARPINRPAHDTPEGVAKGIAKMIENRERERILTPLGKATAILQRISPTLLDYILQGRELKN